MRPSRRSQSPVRAGDVSAWSASSRMTFRPFSVATSARRLALDVADVDEALDDRRARRRRADARVLHRLAQLVVVDELARRLHRAEQRRVGVAARRLGLLLERLGLARRRRLAALEDRQLLVVALVLVGGAALADRQLAVDAAPARHEQDPAAGAEDVAPRPSSRRACSRTRRPGGRRPGSGARRGRDTRRSSWLSFDTSWSEFVGMIAWWSPTFASSTTRPSGSRSRPVTYFAPAAYSGPSRPTLRGGRLDLGDHVARQVARARPRIREDLVLLVAALRGRERAAGGEAVARVRLALERREVEQERRALGALGLVELRDLAAPALDRRDDRLGVGRALQARLRALVEAAGVAAVVVGGEARVDEPVLLGLEGADLLLAPGEDRERRRLHAAERHRAVERRAQPDRRGARRVHADDPVGLGARLRRLLELLHLLVGARVRERVAHRLLRHRRQPQALDRLVLRRRCRRSPSRGPT